MVARGGGSRRAVDFVQQTFHLVHGFGQSLNVVPRQSQGGDLGQFPNGGSLGVWHDFPETVHGKV